MTCNDPSYSEMPSSFLSFSSLCREGSLLHSLCLISMLLGSGWDRHAFAVHRSRTCLRPHAMRGP